MGGLLADIGTLKIEGLLEFHVTRCIIQERVRIYALKE